MGVLADLKILYHMALKPVRGESHAERLESFYAGQAAGYDDFRRRLLQGRESLIKQLPLDDQAVWVDMGGGTGANLEFVGPRLDRLKHVYVVDLSASLLKVAEQRSREQGWTHVSACVADATTFCPPEPADVVTFSYSLTMIPDWFAAIDNALAMLRPGGRIAVVDFYVGRKYPPSDQVRHGWFTRNFWPVWFASDNVFPSSEHLPYLLRHTTRERLEEHRGRIPYLPFVRAPYYIYVGRKSSN
jgi:S-adenosylmethionine-diacylgycerolhomoserine-N-methlytransferase